MSIKGLFHTERSCLVRDTHINFLWLLLSYFEKIAHMSVVSAYVSLWLCIFVTLYVRMFVARANKVEGTMS